VYEEVNGFNPQLRIDFNDVDFCLRIRRAGYRIVFTPYARLYHHESASFGVRSQLQGEVDEMRRLWPDVLENDPYYNPNLSRDFADCRVRTQAVAGDV
jgi:GT2 family glycosyltransferase